jgi:cytochrome c oxidase subunit 3
MPLLSHRAGKTAEVVLLPASTEDPNKAAPGLVRIGLLLACGSIAVLFGALVFAYYWRKTEPGVWDQAPAPGSLWISTLIILLSSVILERGRRLYRCGEHGRAGRLFSMTAAFGLLFLISQLTAWRVLAASGVYLQQNPYSGFFYLFTGLHAAHLLGGLGGLWLISSKRRRRREVVDAAAFYWHFLGLLWVALFFVLAH